ncbi:MAG: RidA family protein [Anaerolineae bacterium]|nr:RidA family protein [Anaerolineae bacterium]
MKKALFPAGVPKPLGPYSPGVVASGNLLFVAGQGPTDPAVGKITATTFAGQTEQTLKNVKAIVEGAGAQMSDVVRVGVFLSDMKYFAEMNEVYRRYFPEPYPARTTIQTDLPGFMIEVDAVVALPG